MAGAGALRVIPEDRQDRAGRTPPPDGDVDRDQAEVIADAIRKSPFSLDGLM